MAPSPILFCSHVVDWGGAERVLADLLATLDRERFAPHLLVPGDGPLTERARELEVPIETIPIGGGGPVRKLLSLLPAARAIRRVAERTGSDVCYANSMIAGYAGVLAQRERPHRLRAVWHVHIVSDSAIVRRAQRRARAVITPSREAAAALRRDDADVIENGVPDAFFTAGTEPEHATRLRRELGLAALETGGDGNPTPLVAIVGRIEPQARDRWSERDAVIARGSWLEVADGATVTTNDGVRLVAVQPGARHYDANTQAERMTCTSTAAAGELEAKLAKTAEDGDKELEETLTRELMSQRKPRNKPVAKSNLKPAMAQAE